MSTSPTSKDIIRQALEAGMNLPELNLRNYNEDDIAELNAKVIELGSLAMNALAALDAPQEAVAWMDNKGWTMGDREKRKLPESHKTRWRTPLFREPVQPTLLGMSEEDVKGVLVRYYGDLVIKEGVSDTSGRIAQQNADITIGPAMTVLTAALTKTKAVTPGELRELVRGWLKECLDKTTSLDEMKRWCIQGPSDNSDAGTSLLKSFNTLLS